MLNKKFVLIILSLFIIFTSVSAVCAAELNDTSVDNEVIAAADEGDVISASDEDALGSAKKTINNISLEIYNTGNYCKDTQLHVILKNTTSNQGLANESVEIYVNGGLWKELDTNNNGKIDVKFERNPGTYFIRAEFSNEDVDLATPDYSLILSGLTTRLSLKQTGAYYKDTKLTLTLTNLANGKGVSGEKLSVKFSNGKSATITTNSKGVATYNVPFNPGKYSVTVKTTSKYITQNSVTLKNFVVAKTYLNLIPTKLSTSYGSGKYFTVKVKNLFTKHLMSGVKLKLKVYTGKKYKTVTVTTASNGIAKYDVSKLSIGTHKVIISNANKYMQANKKTSSIKLTKAKLAITAPKVTSGYNNTTSFKITIKNQQTKKVMSGVSATIKVWSDNAYKTFNVKTNKNGQASISTNMLSIADHNVDVIVKATSKINKATAKSTITITE